MFHSHDGVIPPHIWIGTQYLPYEGLEPHVGCFSSPVALYNDCSCPAFSKCCSYSSRFPHTSCGTPMYNMGYFASEAAYNVYYNIIGDGDAQYSFHCIGPVELSEDRPEFSDPNASNSLNAIVSVPGMRHKVQPLALRLPTACAQDQLVQDDASNVSSAHDDTPNLEDVLQADVCNYIYGDLCTRKTTAYIRAEPANCSCHLRNPHT